MSDEQLLEKIRQVIASNNNVLLEAVDERVRASEKRTAAKIEASQEDTIDVLSEVMNNGYNLHEERITRIEDELDLPPLKQKH